MNEKYIIGKTLLVCLNIFTSEKEFLRREQFYGKIKSVDDDVITVCTADGEVHTLPADFSALRNAKSVYIHWKTVEQLKTPISFLFGTLSALNSI